MALKWLVAYDFSPCSDAALEVAKNQLAGANATIILLHVHRPLSSQFATELTSVSPAFTDADQTIAGAAESRLAGIAKEINESTGINVTAKVVAGYPPDTIAEVAQDEDVDQVVVGSHGRRGIKRVFLGSVAERVVRHSDRSVLVVKRHGDEA